VKSADYASAAVPAARSAKKAMINVNASMFYLHSRNPGWKALTDRDTWESTRDADYVKPVFPVPTVFP